MCNDYVLKYAYIILNYCLSSILIFSESFELKEKLKNNYGSASIYEILFTL